MRSPAVYQGGGGSYYGGSNSYGGGLGGFFGYGGYQQPSMNPFDPKEFAKSLGMDKEDRQRFVQDYKSDPSQFGGLFDSPMVSSGGMFDSSAPIESRIGSLEDAVQDQMQPPQQLGGMMPGYGMGIMPYGGYGGSMPQMMGFY